MWLRLKKAAIEKNVEEDDEDEDGQRQHIS